MLSSSECTKVIATTDNNSNNNKVFIFASLVTLLVLLSEIDKT